MVKLTVWSAAGVTTLAVLAALVVLAGCTTSGGESAEPTPAFPGLAGEGGRFPGGQPPFGGGGGGLGLSCGGDRSRIQVAADVLGLTPQEMITQLRSGVAIEDMAAAAGLTFEEFDAAVCSSDG